MAFFDFSNLKGESLKLKMILPFWSYTTVPGEPFTLIGFLMIILGSMMFLGGRSTVVPGGAVRIALKTSLES